MAQKRNYSNRDQRSLRSGFSTANQTPISLIADQHGKMISDQARRCFSITNQCLIVDQISRQFDSPLFANQLVDCRSTMADVQSFLIFQHYNDEFERSERVYLRIGVVLRSFRFQ